MEADFDADLSPKPSASDFDSSPLNAPKPLEDDYSLFQRRTLVVTIVVALLASVITAFVFDTSTSLSLLLGSLFGLIYFRLLARSIGQLGDSSKRVSRVQLVVPVLLVIMGSKIPQLHLIPSLLGFLLYKPSLVFQALLFSYAKS